MNETPKAVFTRRSTGPDAPPETGDWASPYVANTDLVAELQRLKSEPGKVSLAQGGAAFARSLIAADLVAEYRLVIHPVALGAGLPIFTGLAQLAHLEHLDTIVFPTGAVAQTPLPIRPTD